jgi:hypothetical protein
LRKKRKLRRSRSWARKQPLPQGNRISDLSDDLGEEIVAPAGAFEFAAQGAL